MAVIKNYQQLNKRQIEKRADEVIAEMQAKDYMPRKWTCMAERTADFLDLGIEWESFESSQDGVVAAKIYPSERRVELNQDFQALHTNEGLYQSTIGHEIGHWILHINRDEADEVVAQGELSLFPTTGSQFFLCRTVDEKAIYGNKRESQNDWREWQAQYFSSCLLMPRFKVSEVLQGRSPLDSIHLKTMEEELGVSRRNLVHRLKDLELIQEDRGRIYPGRKLESKEPLLESLHDSQGV
jgi:hypothetical protein